MSNVGIEKPDSVRSLRRSSIAIYGAPAFGLTLAYGPLNAFLPAAYADSTGISLAAIGAAFAFGRIIDGVVDPFIAWLCERVALPGGNRKPWIVVGAITAPLCLLTLIVPAPIDPFIWLLCTLGAFHIAFSLIQIPFHAWGAELSGDYKQRLRIVGWRESFTMAGGVTIPLLPLFLLGAGATPGEIITVFAIASCLLLPVLSVAAAVFGPSPAFSSFESRNKARFGDFLALARNSLPLRRYVLGMACISLSLGCADAIMVIYLRDAIRLTQWVLPLILVRQIVSLLMIPLLLKLVGRAQKHRWLQFGCATQILSAILLSLTPVGSLAVAATSFLTGGILFAVAYVVAPSLLADVADYAELRLGKPSVPMHFAFSSLATKAAIAAGPAVVLPIVSFIGIEPGQVPTSTEIAQFRVVVLMAPAAFALAALLAFSNFPIDRQRQEGIRRFLERSLLRKSR